MYQELHVAFSGEEEGGAAELVDWNLFGQQMAFFMSGAYVEPLKFASQGDIQARKTFEKLYGNAEIEYAENLGSSRGWTEQGWMFDGRHPDLGPVNGPLPLQELIKANYVYTTDMLAAAIAGQIEPTSPPATPEAVEVAL